MSTTVSNEQDGKTLKEFRFPKKPLMMIVGEAKFMCKQNALIEIFHAAGRGVNFSNSFAYDLKNETDVDLFCRGFMEKVKSRKLRKHSQEAVDSFKVVSDGLEHRNISNWDERFEELKKFASNYGHIGVPTVSSEHSGLGNGLKSRCQINQSCQKINKKNSKNSLTDSQ